MTRCCAAVAALALCFFVSALGARAQTIGEAPARQEDLLEAASFAVTIPALFVPDDTRPGRFVTEHYPLDAANITVTNLPVESEERYTNAQKRALEASGTPQVKINRAYTALTADLFEEEMAQSLAKEDPTLQYSVREFARISIRREEDGASFPGFRICATIQGADKEITQEIYMILAKNRILTVTYAQAEDDDFEALFRESAASIAVY